MTGVSLFLLATLAAPVSVQWPQGQTLRALHTVESDGHFNHTRVASWEVVDQRWRVETADAAGRIPVRLSAVRGRKTVEGHSDGGPLHKRIELTGPRAKDPADLWWQIAERAPRRLWLTPDGQRVVAAEWVRGAAAVKARFLAAGGDPEALPMPLDQLLAERVDPVRLSRMLPQVGHDGWVEARAVPSIMNATLEQTLWHRRQDDADGVVDAFDGEGELVGSTALFWMVAVQTNRIHGYSALDAQGRPRARVERLEVEGRVLRPPDTRAPGEAAYGPLRFDLVMQTTWAAARAPRP